MFFSAEPAKINLNVVVDFWPVAIDWQGFPDQEIQLWRRIEKNITFLIQIVKIKKAEQRDK